MALTRLASSRLVSASRLGLRLVSGHTPDAWKDGASPFSTPAASASASSSDASSEPGSHQPESAAASFSTGAAFDEDEDYDDLPTFPQRPSFENFTNSLRPASRTVVFDGSPDDPYKPSSMPIYQTSTFAQPDATSFGPYDYTRSGNPTRTALEKHVAMLERAHACFAFTSGMSALAVLTRLLEQGDEVLLCDDIYGGMFRLVHKVSSRQGIVHKFVDTTNIDAVVEALTPNTKVRVCSRSVVPVCSIVLVK